MSISNQISDIRAARNVIRNKLVSIGVANNTDKLDALATKLTGVAEYTTQKNRIQVDVKEGNTYSIPAGFHDGSGVITAINNETSDTERYLLEAKTVTPSKEQQTVTKSNDTYYGLSSVTVYPIPDQYQDVSNVDAKAEEVLAGKVFVDSTGDEIAGTMVNNGAVSQTLSPSTTSYTVPKGYHNGSGKVSIVLEDNKTITPSTSIQPITAAAGKVLSKVTVAAIPDKYADTTNATIEAADILYGQVGYGIGTDGKAKEITGTMPNNGQISASFSGLDSDTNYYNIPAGYTSGGKVTLTSDIENLLSEI